MSDIGFGSPPGRAGVSVRIGLVFGIVLLSFNYLLGSFPHIEGSRFLAPDLYGEMESHKECEIDFKCALVRKVWMES